MGWGLSGIIWGECGVGLGRGILRSGWGHRGGCMGREGGRLRGFY